MKSSFYEYFNCSSKEELYQKYKNNDKEVQELFKYFDFLKAKNTQDWIKNKSDLVEFLNAYAPAKNELQIIMLNASGQIRKYKNFDYDTCNIKNILKEIYDNKATSFIMTANLPDITYKKLSNLYNNPLQRMEELSEKLESMVGYTSHTIQIITGENQIITNNYDNYGEYKPQDTKRNFLSNESTIFTDTDEYKEFMNYIAKEELRELNLLDDREKIKEILIKADSGLSQENFGIILYDNNNNIKDITNLFVGKIDKSQVDLRLITGILLREDIKGIEILHNHPSGNLRPSRNDISLTEAIEELSTLLEKRFTDHYIIGKGSIFSFKEEGMIENPLRKTPSIKMEKVAEKTKILNTKKGRKIIKRKEKELEL